MIRRTTLGTLGAAPAVRIANLTSGDAQHFKSGDLWRVSIFGAEPGAAIAVEATQTRPDGTISSGAETLGQAGANGAWEKTGAMSEAEVGSWVERWTAGGVEAGALRFTVAPQTAVSEKAGGATEAPGGDRTGAGGSAAGSDHNAESTAAIPSWAWLLAGAALLMTFGGSR
jgi:hypothetical protein